MNRRMSNALKAMAVYLFWSATMITMGYALEPIGWFAAIAGTLCLLISSNLREDLA